MMNLLMTIDRNYLPIMKVCLRSIARFGEGYAVYLLHTDLTDEDCASLQAAFDPSVLQLHPIRLDETLFDDYPDSARYPKTMYYRILAAQLLPDTLERVLYLDPDLVVIRPLAELYETDFCGNYYCACTHVKQVMSRVNQIRLAMPEDYPYVNSGVMLMNLTALRAEQRTEDVAEFLAQQKRKLILPDQDIISALYGDKILLLDTLRFNLSDRVLALNNSNPVTPFLNLEWVRDNTVIIHYCGRNKPWKEHYFGILDVFYHEVADLAQ